MINRQTRKKLLQKSAQASAIGNDFLAQEAATMQLQLADSSEAETANAVVARTSSAASNQGSWPEEETRASELVSVLTPDGAVVSAQDFHDFHDPRRFDPALLTAEELRAMLRNRPSQPRLLPKPPLPPSSGPKAPPSSSRSALSGSELAWARSRSMKEDEAMAPDWLRSGGESKREAGDRRHSVRFEEHGDEDEEDEGCDEDEDEDEVEARVVVGGGEDQYNLHFEAALRRHNARIWRGEAERTVWEDVRRVEQGLPPRATPRRAEWTPEALRLASDLSTAPRGTHRAGSAYTTRAPSDGIRNAFGATGREGAEQGGCKLLYARSRLEDDRF